MQDYLKTIQDYFKIASRLVKKLCWDYFKNTLKLHYNFFEELLRLLLDYLKTVSRSIRYWMIASWNLRSHIVLHIFGLPYVLQKCGWAWSININIHEIVDLYVHINVSENVYRNVHLNVCLQKFPVIHMNVHIKLHMNIHINGHMNFHINVISLVTSLFSKGRPHN